MVTAPGTVTPEEREALFQAYVSVPGLHRIAFEACLADKALRICLKNLAHARRASRRRRGAPEDFVLEAPCAG